MSTQINESLRLNDRTVASGRVVGEWGKLVVDTQAVRLTLHSRHPRVLRDLGYALIDLADDLEVAQRPYVGDEDAERSPGLALMRKGIAEMRDRVARGDERGVES